jgi:hypothetical protein
MKTQRSQTALRARTARPTAPRCRNGVSSLLRLSQPDTSRLPRPHLLSDWAGRAAQLLGGGTEFTVGRLAAPR